MGIIGDTHADCKFDSGVAVPFGVADVLALPTWKLWFHLWFIVFLAYWLPMVVSFGLYGRPAAEKHPYLATTANRQSCWKCQKWKTRCVLKTKLCWNYFMLLIPS